MRTSKAFAEKTEHFSSAFLIASRGAFFIAPANVVAIGYYDLPNYLGIPGENLDKVMHYYHDPQPYYNRQVLVVGGKNSAAIGA